MSLRRVTVPEISKTSSTMAFLKSKAIAVIISAAFSVCMLQLFLFFQLIISEIDLSQQMSFVF
jgi:hypothetical protein